MIVTPHFEACQIRITQGKGKKDRIVPFSSKFKEVLAVHAEAMTKKGAIYLFESIRKKPFSDRGIRKIMEQYAKEAELTKPISPISYVTSCLRGSKNKA